MRLADDVEQPDGHERHDVLLAGHLRERRAAGDGRVRHRQGGGVRRVRRVRDGHAGAAEEPDLDGGCAGECWGLFLGGFFLGPTG